MLKRLMDIFGSLTGLILFTPIMLWLVWRIRREIGAPAIFRQLRAGKDGVPFTLYKFRSMNNRRDRDGNLLPDAQRLTAFGKRLRSSSLDELPQLWNVLKGDMSLVGPRPLLMDYVPLYNRQQKKRLNVRPGITGWAQINGRNSISWEDKFYLDSWYVDHQSFWLDLKILSATVLKTVKRDGISAQGEATMPRFMGTPNHEKEE